MKGIETIDKLYEHIKTDYVHKDVIRNRIKELNDRFERDESIDKPPHEDLIVQRTARILKLESLLGEDKVGE